MTGESIKIAHVLAPAPVGGLETVVSTLVAAQRERAIVTRVIAVVDEGPAHPFVVGLQRRSIPCQLIASHGRAYWREVRALENALGGGETTIVHTHGYRADVLGGLAARRLGCARVSTVHGFTGGDLKNRFYEWLQVRNLRTFDRVVPVSTSVADRLARSRVPQARIVTIQNAYASAEPPMSRSEARRELRLPPEAVVIGWVGRIGAEKALDTLIRAIAELPGAAIVAVVGAGPERESLERLADRLGVVSRIVWCGPIEQAARRFLAFDCLALSSTTEGTPMVLFEAAAAGVPIVTTAVGGIPEVFSDREAWFIRPGVPSELAQVLARVLHHPREAAEKATRARERIQADFSPDRWVERYQSVYREVCR